MIANRQPERYVICRSCQALNASFETVCDECGGPLGATRTLDQSPAGDSHLRKARRLKPLVLLGIWMIFFPMFLSNAYAAFYWATHRHGTLAEFIFFWGATGLTLLSFCVLFWASRKFFAARSKDESQNT